MVKSQIGIYFVTYLNQILYISNLKLEKCTLQFSQKHQLKLVLLQDHDQYSAEQHVQDRF